jgi:large subunit ribosomal protein L24
MALKIRKGDMVVVISGDDRVSGEDKKSVRPRRVTKVYPKEDRVIVEGVNKVYKHVRRSQKHPQGGRIEKEAPIHISNVMLWCANCKRPVRVGMRIEETKKKGARKVRVCKKCGSVIETSK